MATIVTYTTKYGKAVLDEFSQLITPDKLCIEETKNRGECIDTLKCAYNGKVTNCESDKLQDEAYCMIALYVMLEAGAKQLGYDTKRLLPLKTKGALDFLNRAIKNKVIVNDIPMSGCSFYRKSEAPGSTGHVGIVVFKEPNGNVHTIEANMQFQYKGKSYEGIFGRKYTPADIQRYNMKFIHTELLYDNGKMEYHEKLTFNVQDDKKFSYFPYLTDEQVTYGSYALLALATGVGIYYFSRKKRK